MCRYECTINQCRAHTHTCSRTHTFWCSAWNCRYLLNTTQWLSSVRTSTLYTCSKHRATHTRAVLQQRVPYTAPLAYRVGRRVRTSLCPFDGDMLHSRLPLLRGGGALPQGLPAWGEELVEGRHGQALDSRDRMISLPCRLFRR